MSRQSILDQISNHPFIIGCGSQRAGSTLLSRVLGLAPEIYMHPHKEIHYFDTLYEVRARGVLHKYTRNQLDNITRKLCGLKVNHHPDQIEDALRSYFLSFAYPPNSYDYRQHFIPVAARKTEHVYFAENTPEYQLLSAEQFASIKNLLPKAKFIMTVRDPAKRLLSSYNLLINYTDERRDDEQLISDLERRINTNDGWYASQVAYNDYIRCIENMKQAGLDFLVLSMDGMVKRPAESLGKLSGFLGLDLEQYKDSELFNTKVNSFERNLPFEKTMKQRVGTLFAKNKTEIEDYLGEKLEI